MTTYSVHLTKLIEEFALETIWLPVDIDERLVVRSDVNRPGLLFSGFEAYFEPERIQIIGMVEKSYLDGYTLDKRTKALERLCSQKVPAIVVTRGLDVYPELVELSKKYGVPLLRTADGTSYFMAGLTASLNVHLAPRITRHGVLVEVYGEGILMLGESGVGKSETAVELIKRGHRLVADDAVEIKRVSSKSLVGSSPEIIRHFIEIRGIGIVDVRRIFGMGSVKPTEKIDLIVQLEEWDDKKFYTRFGLETETYELLGLHIPTLTIPVKPGRNLAIIIEIAAMNNRQKKMGYNAPEELQQRITDANNFDS